MRSHFGLDVTPVDQVEGFVLTKGKRQTLYLAVVQRGRLTTLDELPRPRDGPRHGLGAAARKVSGAGGSSSRGGTGRRTGDALRRPSRPASAGSAASRRIAWLSPSRSRGFEQDARLGQDDLAGAVDVVADHRAADQQALRQDPRQSLAEAGMDHRVDGLQAVRGSARAAPAP